MPPDESKLARLLPGIAARGAETQESVRRNVRKEAAAALPSAYVAEKKGRVVWWSTSSLVLSLLMGGVAFALSCTPQNVSLPGSLPSSGVSDNFAGSPLRFWQHVPSIIRNSSEADVVLVAAFLVNGLVWLTAALSVWGACHWLIVRWYSRRWKFSLADMLAVTAAAACMLGAWRMDYAFSESESARRFLQTVSEDAQHKPVYQGPLVAPISEVSTPALLFFCLAGASVGINVFHIVDRYALQMRQFK
jgi:hypothetical protein